MLYYCDTDMEGRRLWLQINRTQHQWSKLQWAIINCSTHQRELVYVYSIILADMPPINCSTLQQV